MQRKKNKENDGWKEKIEKKGKKKKEKKRRKRKENKENKTKEAKFPDALPVTHQY